ncbi:MAG TPA: 4-hydroxythreonine-4-phosphate dehydrogenase PdxA, partial [bacterium]|nr:4-hydroxythreonine-4-phosphate dehydrogenase PdxA [bacterium]
MTQGDPAGIGGEVALKALRRPPGGASYLLVGGFDQLRTTAQKLKVRLPLVRVREPQAVPGRVAVWDLGGPARVQWGKVSAANGAAAVRYIEEAARAALAGKVQALVTAPINKEAIHRAGSKFPGHTEMLARISKTKKFAMMMVGGPFKITLQSIHLPLKDAVGQVTKSRVLEKIAITQQALTRWFRVKRPRLAVAGLNPHAGENGAFGREELDVLKPAVAAARAKGWDVTGPHPPDTLFYWAAQGRYDAVLCMYHDQGLIPFKLAAFDSGVNLTLGLPFVRTSPDHGTAFD